MYCMDWAYQIFWILLLNTVCRIPSIGLCNLYFDLSYILQNKTTKKKKKKKKSNGFCHAAVSKCPNFRTPVSDKMAYANNADPDQTAPEEAHSSFCIFIHI